MLVANKKVSFREFRGSLLAHFTKQALEMLYIHLNLRKHADDPDIMFDPDRIVKEWKEYPAIEMALTAAGIDYVTPEGLDLSKPYDYDRNYMEMLFAFGENDPPFEIVNYFGRKSPVLIRRVS